MKLYRATPDQLISLSDVTGYCEDASYKMGYINISSVRSFFTDFPKNGNPLYKGPAGKFFYINPWDAVFCSASMDGGYVLSRIMEYDFPEEIIDESIRGFGEYNYSVPEIKIPYEILEREGVIETPLSQELDIQLRKTKLEILKESVELYKSIKDDNCVNYGKHADEIEGCLSNPGICDTIHGLNIECLLRMINCSYITGRMFPLTKQQRIDRKTQGDSILIEGSNGVLTQENYRVWQENSEKIYQLNRRHYSLNGIDWKKEL